MNQLLNSISLAAHLTLENDRICPACGEYLDSGMGFDRRDFECTECDFFTDYPAELALAFFRLDFP